MQRTDPNNFRVDSVVFKDDESKTEAKTNSGHQVHLLLFRSPFVACTEHAQSPLFAHYTHTRTHT